jgi:LysM repeat protein
MMARRRASFFVLASVAAYLPLQVLGAQSLRGSRASVNRMHSQAVQHDLHFYQTPSGVRRAVENERLVRLTPNRDFELHRVGYPYVKPATRTFVVRIAGQYRAACGEQLVVTGATRPATRQPANASDRSVHPTGIAVDFRKSTNGRCASWLRRTLLSLEREGTIEAIEEYGPPHFHVAVYPTQYLRHVERSTTRVASAPSKGSSRVAAGRTYRVRSGDTLWDIAERHDTTVERLIGANDLDGARIIPGQKLVLPVDENR